MHRVLIIENEQDIRYILFIALARLGYVAVAAKNGIEFFLRLSGQMGKNSLV
jgi:CheY-like chemotaxis protein